MIYLLLFILSSSLLFVNFRLFDRFKVNRKQAITVNYWVCFALGALLLPRNDSFLGHFQFDWTPFALILGFLFYLNFTLTGLTVKKLGLTVTSVSNKMSLVIPVVFSFVFHQSWDNLNLITATGLLLAFIAIFFVSASSNPTELKDKKSLIFLPVSIFLLSGFTDSLSQWCSETKVLEGEQNHFAWLVFGGAAVSSSLLILTRTLKGKVDWAWKSVLGGITLGLPNYASYFFLLQTLDSFDHQGDFVFPIANLGVILISSLMSFGLFSDKISGRQWLGLVVSAISLALISSKSWL